MTTNAHAPGLIEHVPDFEPRRAAYTPAASNSTAGLDAHRNRIGGYTHDVPPSRDPWGTPETGRALFDKARDAARSRLGATHIAKFHPGNGLVSLTVEDYARLTGAAS